MLDCTSPDEIKVAMAFLQDRVLNVCVKFNPWFGVAIFSLYGQREISWSYAKTGSQLVVIIFFAKRFMKKSPADIEICIGVGY